MRVRILDRVYWTLDMHGPMTREALAVQLDLSRRTIAQALVSLRRSGCVELVDSQAHRNRHGMKCGQWRCVADEATEAQTA